MSPYYPAQLKYSRFYRFMILLSGCSYWGDTRSSCMKSMKLVRASVSPAIACHVWITAPACVTVNQLAQPRLFRQTRDSRSDWLTKFGERCSSESTRRKWMTSMNWSSVWFWSMASDNASSMTQLMTDADVSMPCVRANGEHFEHLTWLGSVDVC